MQNALITVLLCGLASLAACQYATQRELEQLAPASFVYLPAAFGVAPNSTTAGVSTKRSVAEWPALKGSGIAQTFFTVQPCAARVPHHHPHASGLLYAINAASLEVGLVLSTGETVVNTIKTGASALFPQGLVHYQRNLDCQPATYVITYNDEEAATVNEVPALLDLPGNTVMDVLGLNVGQYQSLLASARNGSFTAGAASDECRQRCASTVVPISVSGRKMK